MCVSNHEELSALPARPGPPFRGSAGPGGAEMKAAKVGCATAAAAAGGPLFTRLPGLALAVAGPDISCGCDLRRETKYVKVSLELGSRDGVRVPARTLQRRSQARHMQRTTALADTYNNANIAVCKGAM